MLLVVPAAITYATVRCYGMPAAYITSVAQARDNVAKFTRPIISLNSGFFKKCCIISPKIMIITTFCGDTSV